ncbi:MAG: PHP domain-containing protein [Firmicutes bacterium]|nr:PHP domain-containing protein [Bacillota bacterium]
MGYKVDYHVHSWCSDGVMKPTDLVRKYHDEEYDIISITDHDGIDGVKEAMIAGEALRMQVIAGVELAVSYEDKELHLLGYRFDPDNEPLNQKMEELKRYRRTRNEKLLKALQDMGYDLTEEDLIQRPGQTYIGKPNFARALARKGYIRNPKDAFAPGKLLESEAIKAIPRQKISAEEAIDLLRNAGGITVLAHPAKIKKLGSRDSEAYWKNFEELLCSLKKLGLKGLECYYPTHTHEETLRFVDLAAKYHLHITEGSDFHGGDLR